MSLSCCCRSVGLSENYFLSVSYFSKSYVSQLSVELSCYHNKKGQDQDFGRLGRE